MPTKLTLVSYNIQDGIHEDLIVNNIHKMVAEGADIFCLQETRIIKSSFIIDRLKAELGNEWQVESFLGMDNPRTEIGLTLLWKSTNLHLQELEKVLLPKLNYVSLYERCIACVLKPVQRGAMIATFIVNGGLVRITNLHLDFKGGTSRRMSQVEYLALHLSKKSAVLHEIIAGDFNTTGGKASSKYQQNQIERLLGEDFTDAFPDLKWTFDGASVDSGRIFSGLHTLLVRFGARLYRRLDYVFLKNVDVIEAKMEKLKGSDHYPLIITLWF